MSSVTWTNWLLLQSTLSLYRFQVFSYGLFVSCELQDCSWTRNWFIHRKKGNSGPSCKSQCVALFLGLFCTTQLKLYVLKFQIFCFWISLISMVHYQVVKSTFHVLQRTPKVATEWVSTNKEFLTEAYKFAYIGFASVWFLFVLKCVANFTFQKRHQTD